MSQTEAWTIGRLLTWTTDYLKQHGADTPRLDAELLLAEAKGCPRIALYTAFADVAEESERTAFRELVRRRAEGTPVAYLLGRREFYSLSFRVTPDVLIPRPETEFVVVALLDRVKERAKDGGAGGEALAIADVGTGSGILAVCAAKYVPTARVTAIDISPAALDVARANAADHAVAGRIEFVEGDLLECVGDGATFDFIVSNPPYVSENEFAELAPDVREHEPKAALVAGERGTEAIERLVAQAAQRLRPGGWLLVEVSPMIEPAVRALIEAERRLELAATVKDLAGLPRVVQARRRE
jgi:release factor glutamine methyltransferase